MGRWGSRQPGQRERQSARQPQVPQWSAERRAEGQHVAARGWAGEYWQALSLT